MKFAIALLEDEGKYGAVCPDVAGVFFFGSSDKEKVKKKARALVRDEVKFRLEVEELPVPTPTPVDLLQKEEVYEDVLEWFYVEV